VEYSTVKYHKMNVLHVLVHLRTILEWIECTNKDCRVWSHADCFEQCDDAYVCVACQALLA